MLFPWGSTPVENTTLPSQRAVLWQGGVHADSPVGKHVPPVAPALELRVNCVSRAGHRRLEHAPDKDGRCVFCDCWLDA